MTVSAKDRQVLRELAQRFAEIAANPAQEQKLAEWKRHNALKPGRPLVLQAPEGVWDEFVPLESLVCEEGPARNLEHELRMRLYRAAHFRDDYPFSRKLPVHLRIKYPEWRIRMEHDRDPDPRFDGVHGAVRYKNVLSDDADIEKLMPCGPVTPDWDATRREFEQVNDLVGDLLNVEIQGRTEFGVCPMDLYIQWRGVEQGLLDMMDRPEYVHRALTCITDHAMDVARQLEAAGALSLTEPNEFGAAGMAATNKLPSKGFDGKHVRLMDIWGGAATQIFSEVSPAMHDEFAIRYESRFMSLFGLNSYGCCEPLHKKVHLVRKLPRVIRLSMSPWVNDEEGAAAIGHDFIFSKRPNPSYLASNNWDIEPCRKEIQTVLAAAKRHGCVVEFIMKDTHTCRGQPARYDQWTDMAMRLAADF